MGRKNHDHREKANLVSLLRVDQLYKLTKSTKFMTAAVYDEVCYIDELCVQIHDLQLQIDKMEYRLEDLYDLVNHIKDISSLYNNSLEEAARRLDEQCETQF